MPRFVVLEHRRDGLHWDFMLEADGVLRTWALDRPIVSGPSQPARPLADHRAVYLDYEGPISGDRGVVKRIQSGIYEPKIWRDDHVIVALSGEGMTGEAEFTRDEGGVWTFAYVGKFA